MLSDSVNSVILSKIFLHGQQFLTTATASAAKSFTFNAMSTQRHPSPIFILAALLLMGSLVACTNANRPPPTPMPEWTHTTTLANNEDHPISVAADDEFVYFTAGGP